MFDVGVHLDELRSWPTERLVAHHEELVGEQRRLHLEDLDVLRVLDERGRIDPTVGADGESARTIRAELETARRLESLPEIAAVAHAGRLSDDQLRSVVQLADERSDAEWASRAPHIDPCDLARRARSAAKPTAEESRAQHEARRLRMWWTDDRSTFHLHGQLPVVMGKTFEDTITKLTEQMRPAAGRPWDTFEHRCADALVQLCAPPGSADEHEPTLAPRAGLQVGVPLSGPAEIAGIPISDSLLEQLRANSSIELVLHDDRGMPVAMGKRSPALSPKVARAVLLRDGHCRMPGCEHRRGLEIHHLRPRSWGGTDEPSNLARVCAAHHRRLVPHGTLALEGNPNQPDGLALVPVEAADLPPP